MKFWNIWFLAATFFLGTKQRLTEQRATVQSDLKNFFKKMQLHKLVQLEQADGTSLELFKSIFFFIFLLIGQLIESWLFKKNVRYYFSTVQTR
jgi:hypothetical protein